MFRRIHPPKEARLPPRARLAPPRLLLWILVVACLLSRVTASAVGPIRLWPRKGAFAWKAAVDRASGIATSTETSDAPKRSRLRKTLDETDDEDMLRLTKDLFSSYPLWLCRFPVTFGILKAVPADGGGYEIRDRLFGCHFLTFGNATTRRLAFNMKAQDGTPIHSSQSTVSLPITGGFLSRRPRKKESSGALVCTMSTRREGKGDSKEHLKSCSITTQIVGYRPWLTGDAPIHPVRAWLYLSTQSIVHAHVTWRLHRRCWNYSERTKEKRGKS
jgi:hypothetical protein